MEKEDRRYQRTRQAIHDAMWQLIREKDFSQISVGEIAQRANINRVTFYRHYEDKYAWLHSCIQELLKDLFAIRGAVSFSFEVEDLDGLFLDVCNHFDRNFEVYSVLLRNEGIRTVRDHFKGVIYSTPIENVPSLESMVPEKQMEYHFLMSAIAGTIEWWIRIDRPMNAEALAKKLVSMHRSLLEYER